MQSNNDDPIQQKVKQIIQEAQQAIAAGDQQTAVVLLDQVLSQHPDHPDANYQSALLDLQVKGSEAALKKFERAVTNKPQSESHWIGYIETLIETASLEIVLEALELGQQYALTANRAQDLAAKFLAKSPDGKQPSNLEQTTPVDHANARDIVSGYQYHQAENYYYPQSQSEFAYKDVGNTQNKLFNLLSRTQDRSVFSPELLGQGSDWPMFYHLTPMRANLLRPFITQLASGKTLELGAGCGAVTRFIGELGGDVVALEGSRDRARVIGKRCEDLPNVTVIADLIQHLNTDEKFDVVTLIGVLEYSQVFVDEPDPVQFILNKAKSFLKEDGILIVAIENQLGLKYFAGAAEDHLGQAMFGINDSYTDKTAITFGRKALTKQIKQAGFKEVELYVPLPDYKTPVSIVYPLGFSDEAEEAGFNVGTLLAGSNVFDKQKPTVPTMSLENAWQVVGRNGLGQDLANSFLFVARQESKPFTGIHKPVLAAHYGAERPKQFAKETEIVLQPNGVKALTRMVGDTQSLLEHHDWEQTDYHEGTLWYDELLKLMNRPGWDYSALSNWAVEWVTALRNIAPAKPENTIPELQHFKTLLPANYIDATPTNYIVNTEGQGQFFDLEWNFSIALPIEFVVFRGLYLTLHRVTSCAKPASDVPVLLMDITKQVMQEQGFVLSQYDWDLFIELFNTFQNKTQGVNGQQLNGITQSMDVASLPVRQLFS